MNLRSVEEARAALARQATRFTASRTAASLAFDALEAEARDTAVPGFTVVGRASEELLLTFSGFGIYFRFSYTATAEYVEYGAWSYPSDGVRQYTSVGEWRVDANGFVGGHEPGALREYFLPSAEAVITAHDRWLGHSARMRASAHLLACVVPHAVIPTGRQGVS